MVGGVLVVMACCELLEGGKSARYTIASIVRRLWSMLLPKWYQVPNEDLMECGSASPPEQGVIGQQSQISEL